MAMMETKKVRMDFTDRAVDAAATLAVATLVFIALEAVIKRHVTCATELVRAMPRYTYWIGIGVEGLYPFLVVGAVSSFDGDMVEWLDAPWSAAAPVPRALPGVSYELLFVGIFFANMVCQPLTCVPLSGEILLHHAAGALTAMITLCMERGFTCFVLGVGILEVGSLVCNVADLWPTPAHFALLRPIMTLSNLLGIAVAWHMVPLNEYDAASLFMFGSALGLCFFRQKATMLLCRNELSRAERVRTRE